MRTYGQYCPIARAAEILAERWTPIIVRNLLLGATSFNQIADGAPGISRTLLTYRLRDLERAGVIQAERAPGGRRVIYRLTGAGRDLGDVMLALGTWGERWMELGPQHLDPGVVLDSWVRWYLARELLPDTRIVVRFEFPDRPRKGGQMWMIFDGERSEVCRTNPGFDEDLVVTSTSAALAEWHLGRSSWIDFVRSGAIDVSGPPRLARALPTWNHRSGWAHLHIARGATETPSLVAAPSRVSLPRPAQPARAAISSDQS